MRIFFILFHLYIRDMIEIDKSHLISSHCLWMFFEHSNHLTLSKNEGQYLKKTNTIRLWMLFEHSNHLTLLKKEGQQLKQTNTIC